MTFVSREVFLVDQEVVVCVQLPEPTVEHVEMLIAKVGSHFVYVFLVADNLKHIEEVWIFEISIGYVSIVIRVEWVENAHYNCICIALLELRCLLEEFETWMCLEHMFKHWLEVITYYSFWTILGYYFEQSLLRVFPMITIILPESLQYLPVAFGRPW